MQPSPADHKAHFLQIAASQSGRTIAELSAELEDLGSKPGRIDAEEYVRYGLYDSVKFSRLQKESFISDALHWPLVRRCCDMSWFAVTEDKWVAAKILAASGIPTPEILAVADPGPRLYPGAALIHSLADFQRFLAAWQGREFFGKQLRGLGSSGVFRCERHDDQGLFLTGRGQVGIAQFYESHLRGRKYIFQPVQRNHAFFDGICHNLATVRIGALVYQEGVRLAFSFLKVPGSETLEDRFHPVGNIACGLAPETGEIMSIRQRTAFGAVSCAVHPETGRSLIGLRLPWWDELCRMVVVASRVFAPVRYQTFDIALTPQGPVVLEINTGGGFNAPQLVLERGLLQSPFGRFLKDCGIEIAQVTPNPK